MAALDSIPGIVGIIETKVTQEQRTCAAITEDLKETYPNVRYGLSARSIRRFCKMNGIHITSRLSDNHLDRFVRSSVAKVNTPEYLVPMR